MHRTCPSAEEEEEEEAEGEKAKTRTTLKRKDVYMILSKSMNV